MESTKSSVAITRKKVLGILFLIVFSLAFIFACMKNVLPIGKTIVGTFGILTYPMLLFLMLVSLASSLGFSYARSPKATFYFCATFLSILLFIQCLTTFKQLDLVVNFESLKQYLTYSYQTKTTFLGACGSVVCGFLSILLGAMGSIVVFVILATLFGGLFIDYQVYGKYQEPHVKKLKTRALREKVYKSDKKTTPDKKPIYSFSNESSNEVVGEITINESEINDNTTIYDKTTNYYSNEDVVDEITNEQIYTGYNENVNSYEQNETQSQNTFSNEFYKEPDYPSAFDDEDAKRREFMNATFGGYSSQQTQPYESNYSSSFATSSSNDIYSQPQNMGESNNYFDDDETPSIYASSNDLFGEYQNSSNDELSKILRSSEDEFENDIKQDVFEAQNDSFSNFGINYSNSSNVKRDQFGFEITSEPEEIETPVEPIPDFGNIFAEPQPATNFNNQIKPTAPVQNFQSSAPKMPEPPKVEIPAFKPEPPKVEIPQKPISNGFSGLNMSMPGVRYNPPPLNLLKPPKEDKGDYTEEQNRKSMQLEQVLAAFNVPAKVKNIVRGPKITRFELSVPLGVSVNKIPRYEDDIAAALAAKTIVIKAPIPGSPYVGIELENDTFTSVFERELLESSAFQNCKDPLPIAIGKDISGEIVVKSLAKMVHLLIAGSTGSGKSVFMHNIIMSLIYKSSPDDLRLIMIDPKKVEFNRYNGIPHLLTPEVVAGSDKAINAFKWCVKEMERRYDLMSKAGYNNIEPYNKSELVKAGQFDRFPYIVIVVDELAEIMAVNKKEVELCIQRLTQLARACGMHLIVATQRPSVDIITGVIKNNIPSRIAFSLQSGIDSKTILNAVGAEKLLGQGDMIFAPTGTSATPRLQGAYATDDEIKAVIDYVKKNNPSNYDETVNNIINSEQPTTVDEVGGMGAGGDMPPQRDTVDSYFKTAVKLVMANNGASVSYLQRRLSIGYSRAARIIDQMEDKGYIAPTTGSKLRKVLITPEQFREDFGEEYDSID